MHKTKVCEARKKVLGHLANKEHTLANAIDSMTTGVLISDPKLKDNPIIYCNKAFSQITGYSFDEAISRNCNFLQGRDTDSDTIAKIGAAITAKKSITVEILNYRKDGGPFWNFLTIFPIYDVKGNLVNFAGTQQDITELREAKAERSRLERELAQSRKVGSLGALAGGIAHEINTPIQYIGDNLKFLKAATEDLMAVVDTHYQLVKHAEAKGMLSHIIENYRTECDQKDIDFLRDELPLAAEQAIEGVKQVTNIVRAMKEFTHPTQKEMAPVNLNRIIERSALVCRAEWKQFAELKYELDKQLPQVIGDESSLNQVVVNLIVNAAHAIAKCKERFGEIIIRTKNQDSSVQLEIEDNGEGITDGNKDQIFNPFFTTKDVGEGTGQGLAFVHEVVVTRLGGEIDVKSIIGTGTTFIIKIPIPSD